MDSAPTKVVAELHAQPLPADYQLARFRPAGADKSVVVAITDEKAIELATTWSGALSAWSRGEMSLRQTGREFPRTGGHFDVPLGPLARGLFCVGMNYPSHRLEVDSSLGQYTMEKPVIFSKLNESLLASDEGIVTSKTASAEFDWEVELGVVIGKAGSRISREDAHDHVAGYTLVNDITARDVQRAHSQWFLGKNIHRSTPVGPSIVHRDAMAWEPHERLRLSVNGEAKQDGSTADMVHGIGVLIETISSYVELQVGDIIASGSPAGVGFTRQPPEFLRVGDVVRAELVGFLSMENVVE